VLRDVDLRIDADECVGLVGRSGSGKTTLARCLAGLHPIESGRIHLHGVSVPMLGQRSADQVKRIQYVWQDVAGSFDPARPVVDQVMRTAQRLGGRDAVSARRETQACLASLGLPADTVGRRPRALSGGELRRAALARALLAEPDLLIGDEITSSLDAERAVEILTLLNDLRRITGMALLLISHDQALLERSADRIVSLDELWSGAATA
jgi:peptide/nickel transport system ATP-binding protein